MVYGILRQRLSGKFWKPHASLYMFGSLLAMQAACAHASVDHQALANSAGDAAAGECHGLRSEPWAANMPN